MNTIQITERKVKYPYGLNLSLGPNRLVNKYMDYAASKEDDKVYWYLKAVIMIPGVYMVLTTIMMKMATENFIWFVALSMLIFFANLMLHISDQKSTIFVPFYHASVLVMFLIPAITYILSL